MRAMVALSVLTIAGCATQPDKIGASYVSAFQYDNYDCAQLSAELNRVNARASALHGSLKQTADNDAAQLGLGLVLFWPTLFFLEGGDGAEAQEYSRLKGERAAIEQAAIQKHCGTATARAAPSASSPQQVAPQVISAAPSPVAALSQPRPITVAPQIVPEKQPLPQPARGYVDTPVPVPATRRGLPEYRPQQVALTTRLPEITPAEAYASCANARLANAFSLHQPPEEIAIAAVAKCSIERNAYQASLQHDSGPASALAQVSRFNDDLITRLSLLVHDQQQAILK